MYENKIMINDGGRKKEWKTNLKFEKEKNTDDK